MSHLITTVNISNNIFLVAGGGVHREQHQLTNGNEAAQTVGDRDEGVLDDETIQCPGAGHAYGGQDQVEGQRLRGLGLDHGDHRGQGRRAVHDRHGGGEQT